MANGEIKRPLGSTYKQISTPNGNVYVCTYGKLVIVSGDLHFTSAISDGDEIIDTGIQAYEKAFAGLFGQEIGDLNIQEGQSKIKSSSNLPSGYYRFTMVYLRY